MVLSAAILAQSLLSVPAHNRRLLRGHVKIENGPGFGVLVAFTSSEQFLVFSKHRFVGQLVNYFIGCWVLAVFLNVDSIAIAPRREVVRW